ncbi:TIGR04338 family metallohydrolase [Skermania piniformis]|uniref:TIGR04338 family metallohydrolase n=1 Tax=Skermania pinensis TaxID=39122 RepID=A0ABX8SBJ1_9ACTN|nr:TIGR04338 family metallohydrolase [Skermania piniformis]QXQ13815.1 TIGR04338 family metallohydrolase [Skermania piniformis]
MSPGRSPAARPRDVQRSRVYDAEQLLRTLFDHADAVPGRTIEAYGTRLTLPVERRFGSVAAVQDYTDRLLALTWVGARWPRAAIAVRVRARAGHRAAHYEPDTSTLALPEQGRAARWALRELVVLHELTHHLDSAPATHAAHGPEFCGRQLELVDEVIGAEAAFLLRTTYLQCGVRLG